MMADGSGLEYDESDDDPEMFKLKMIFATLELTQVLLNGADVDKKDRFVDSRGNVAWKTALHHAIDSKDIYRVGALIERKANVNLLDYDCAVPPLLQAVGLNSVKMAELLVHGGADVNLYSPMSMESPRTLAASKGLTTMCELLARANASDYDPPAISPANDLWIKIISEIPKEKQQLVGEGSFGKVFKMTRADGKVFATKLVGGLGGLDAWKSEKDSIIREFRLVRKLLHPRIVKVFDFAVDEKEAKAYLIMEFVDGGSLNDAIQSKKFSTDDDKLPVVIQILEGVVFLHKEGIFHCDIKPRNILLTMDNSVKLCDFGISKRVATKSTRTGTHFKGDLRYASPEVLAHKPRDEKGDTWCVGSTVVHFVTGNTLNHKINPDFVAAIAVIQYELYYDGLPLDKQLQSMPRHSWVRLLLTNTLCKPDRRASAEQLLTDCRQKQFSFFL